MLLLPIASSIAPAQINGGAYLNARTALNGHDPATPQHQLPQVLVITSYPPRECGIATYSEDLIKALQHKFGITFSISICALEEGKEKYAYKDRPAYTLDTECSNAFVKLAFQINRNPDVKLVLLQHEFGFFRNQVEAFERFLEALDKPVVTVFHTVLSDPDPKRLANVRHIAEHSSSLIVMTTTSMQTLERDYAVPAQKINVIPHGTHLINHQSKDTLKEKHGLQGRKVLSTFGLLSSGKGIATTLDALPAIVQEHPETLFLIIGKTHPGVVKQEGERYRESLQQKVEHLGLQQNVRFVNRYLPLPELLEYLQLTDIYLFTSTDPLQAVSGTFSYALSCGCPVISTPFPHAREVLCEGTGVLVDFANAPQLAAAVIDLLQNDQRRTNIGSNALHRMASAVWENSAIAHASLFSDLTDKGISLRYALPDISLDHLRRMTTSRGMIQFSKLDRPDIGSGYTVDDNARAMVAVCQHFELTGDKDDIPLIRVYLNFIVYCQQEDGNFLNYVDENGEFTPQNDATNLEDANGRAIWALGHLCSMRAKVPQSIHVLADNTIQLALDKVSGIHSTRAMGFIIKGLYYRDLAISSDSNLALIARLADRLVQMYRHEADDDWHWFEDYFTYANGILPEALLCAFEMTGKEQYGEIAKASFDFLLSKVFSPEGIRVVSNKGWMHRSDASGVRPIGGEQPIDVAYTILALDRFHRVFREPGHRKQMHAAFEWFLGRNHLHRIIYNPCTGGCYDGLEEYNVNLNQGAESTVSYLMARLVMENRQPAHRFESQTYQSRRRSARPRSVGPVESARPRKYDHA
ncbi:MAG: glycosyltransferase [Flavobacteriales bacterium]|nr:glycosyltransferase [Flavobacteriales bacterium]